LEIPQFWGTMSIDTPTQTEIILKDLHFIPYISAEEIGEKVLKMGKKLNEDYSDKKPIFIAILNGAFVFAADLIRAYDRDCEVQFVKLRSYEGTTSSGVIKQSMVLDAQLRGEHLVLIEDIIDTGNTLEWFIPEVIKIQPASLKVASLLVKGDGNRFSFNIDYKGFEITDEFVVGYGLDYDGLGRNLRDIYQLKN